MTPFSQRVGEGLKRSGMTLRELCRAVSLDPSFFSKVLAGKRSPPAEEDVLRRIAAALSLDAADLIVSAGRIPSEWQGVWTDPELFSRVHRLATGGVAAAAAWTPRAPASSAPRAEAKKTAPASRPHRPQSLSEELL